MGIPKLNYIKKELKKRSKESLIMIILGLHANEGKMKNLLMEYKVYIRFFIRKLNLTKAKLKLAEGTKEKRNYSYLGSKHNRNIATSKRNWKRRKIKNEK